MRLRKRGGRRAVAEDPEFVRFYEAYPRKCSRGVAEKAWVEMAAVRPPLPVLLEAVERLKRMGLAWDKTKHPASWLRAKAWADEIPVNGATTNGSPLDEDERQRLERYR